MSPFTSAIALGLLAISSVSALGPAAVNLGTAANFVVLAKTGVTVVPTSHITGAVGVSPVTSTALSGFTLLLDGSGAFATSSQVTGRLYAANYKVPTPGTLTTAIGSVESAYTDANGRPSPNFLNLNSGSIGGLILTPGLYKWSTVVTATQDVTLTGSATDIWIFQIAGTFTLSTNKKIVLLGGAIASHVFWVISDAVTISSGATAQGVILAKTKVSLGTGATVRGRILAQTFVTVTQANVIEA